MKTILVCDDERHMLRLIEHTLARTGHRILTASDGAAALEMVRSGGVDLLLLDVMMPGQDGLSVLAEIRRDAAKSPRIIMLTSRGLATTRDEAARHGVDAFITKPFSPIELKQLVESMLV